MPKQRISYQVKIATTALHLICVNGKLASRTLCLVQVKFRCHFKYDVSNLNANWLQFRCNFFARCHNLAEVVIIHAVKTFSSKIFLPFFYKLLKGLIWNSKIRAASINNSWPFLLLSEIEFFSIVVHVSSLEGPLFNGVHPVRSVCHCLYFFEASNTTDNLILIQTTEDGI